MENELVTVAIDAKRLELAQRKENERTGELMGKLPGDYKLEGESPRTTLIVYDAEGNWKVYIGKTHKECLEKWAVAEGME